MFQLVEWQSCDFLNDFTEHIQLLLNENWRGILKWRVKKGCCHFALQALLQWSWNAARERETNALFGLKNGRKTEHRLGILYSEDRTQKLCCFKLQKFHSHGCHFLRGPSIGSTTNDISGESHEKHHTGKLLTTLNQLTYVYGSVVPFK